MKKVKELVFAGFVLALFSYSGSSSALVITDTAIGSLTPAQVPAGPGAFVTNGDFTITQLAPTPGSPNIGDGLNDFTNWVFDFTADPDFPSFSTVSAIDSALLTLTLTTTVGIDTDTLAIQGLAVWANPTIRALTPGTTPTVQIQLLDFYTSSEVLSVLTSPTAGQIPMVYEDDSIVSFAQLDLVAIPEPGMIALLGLGLIGLGFARRRRPV